MKQKYIIITLLVLLFSFSVPAVLAEDNSEKVVVYYFYDTKCPSCASIKPTMLDLVEKYPNVEFKTYNVVSDESVFYTYVEVFKILNETDMGVPLVVIGNDYFRNPPDINDNLENSIIKYLDEGAVDILSLGSDIPTTPLSAEPLFVYYFYSEKSLDDTYKLFIDLKLKYPKVEFLPVIIDRDDGMGFYKYAGTVLNQIDPEIPFVLVGTSVFYGNDSIINDLENTIINYAENGFVNAIYFDADTGIVSKRLVVNKESSNSEVQTNENSSSNINTTNSSLTKSSDSTNGGIMIGVLLGFVLCLLLVLLLKFTKTI